jgi:hypothetical protein
MNQKVMLRRMQYLGYRADAVSNGLGVLEALYGQPLPDTSEIPVVEVLLGLAADAAINPDVLPELRDSVGKGTTVGRVEGSDRYLEDVSQLLPAIRVAVAPDTRRVHYIRFTP